MSPDPLGGTCCFQRLQPRRLGGSMYISSDARSSHRMAFTQRQQDTGCHGDSSPDPPRPQKPKQAPSLVAPTGLPADNHITRHPSCWWGLWAETWSRLLAGAPGILTSQRGPPAGLGYLGGLRCPGTWPCLLLQRKASPCTSASVSSPAKHDEPHLSHPPDQPG